MGGKLQRDATIFMGEVETPRHHVKIPCKDFDLAIEGGLGWMQWLKNGAEEKYISWNYSCTISSLVKMLLIKLKYLYIHNAAISIMKKQNSNQM